MSVTEQEIEVQAPDGGLFEAFVAAPDDGTACAVLVLPEVFGANEDFRATVPRALAEAGHVTQTPDIYWRLAPRSYFAYGPEGQASARALRDRLDIGALVVDLGACIERLREHPRCNGSVAVMGFCLGGRLAYLAGTRLPVAGIVSYYGVRIEDHLDEADALHCPALLHFAQSDDHVPEEAVAAIRARLEVHDNVTIHTYPETGHAFNRRGHPQYVESAAALAWERSLALLSSL